ncbi:MAG: hypothetical protein ACOC80_16645 [Petrotogales bacterium]
MITKEIEYYGEDVTHRSVTSESHSDWGDVSETTTDTTITAVVNVMDSSMDYVREGEFKAGDKTFFISPDIDISRGDRIKHDGKWYEVDEIIDYTANDIGGSQKAKEVRTEKI